MSRYDLEHCGGGGPLLANIGDKRESNDKCADIVVLRVVQTLLQLLE